MQSETGFPSSHKLKSYVASKSRLKLAARAVLSADAGLLVITVTAGNLMFKYPDDISFVIPAANANSRSAELDHVDRWAQNNNVRLNRAKSAEIIFTNCKRKSAEGLPP